MTYWTTRAWTDSNRDGFERNLIYVGSPWSSAEAAAYAEWEPNNSRPGWPTIDEVTRWAQSINNYPGVTQPPTLNVENLQLALDAAIERVATRTHFQVRPVDANGDVDPGGTAVEIPATVKLATIMLAVRLARRAMTPDGLAGSADLLIRTSSIDPDIESMLAPWLALGLY